MEMRSLNQETQRYLMQFARRVDLSPDDILREVVGKWAVGVEVFAVFLETQGCTGLVKKLAERFLSECRPFLEEALPFEGETLQVLQDPRKFFNVSDEHEAIRLTTLHFMARVNSSSPQHVIRAMIAHIEFGLGNYVNSINSAGFTHNEKRVPNFSDIWNNPNQRTLLESTLLAVEWRKAEILIDVLKSIRLL